MSNSVNIEALLAAVDQARRPFKSLQTANVSLADGIKATEKNLSGLYGQLAQVDGLMRAEKALTSVNVRLETMQQRAQKLAEQGPPTRSHASILQFTQQRVSQLHLQRLNLTATVASRKSVVTESGLDAAAPLAAKLRLKSRISDSSAQLVTQQQSLKQENRQQRQKKIQDAQQSITGMSGKVASLGKTSMSVANTGFSLGKKLLQPGYEASLQARPTMQPAPADTAVASLQQNAGNRAQPIGNQQQSGDNAAAATQNNAGNLGTDLAALQAAYQSLSVDIFATQESSLRMLVQTATGYLGQLQQWVQNNQGLVQSFGLIATVIVGVAGAIGTVASVIAPVFTGISTLITIATTFGSVFTTVCGGIMAVIGGLTWPIVAVVAAIAAGAALIYKYWEPISAFFSGVIEGITAAFAPIAEMFAPLQPAFDAIGSALQTVKGTFIELLTPIKASEETLTQFGNVGQIIGKVLVTAFTWPLTLFRSLSESATGLLETLGIIDKKPAQTLKPLIEQPATGGVSSYIQPTSAQPGYNAYQMARPSTGGSYLDQSRTEYNVTLQGDVTPGSNNERYLQELFRQDANNRRNNALSQFNP
ncbi:phage tail tape measure protein [Kosakonia pseudosacchari]|uniref:phage tail tape measure protein n=1 Tax=Kosakonia pseudosacchari TaxID=1646340 RepID=UPI0022F03F82|nr:phage tail tape measure protein [Kosakonia pseudosacchari]WBU50483.1 phage tail tape measure protein [Kosakonia pseudosacchari]